MKLRIFAVVVALVGVFAAPVAAQSAACTDATRTVCSVKKNQPFSLTADPADTSDSVPTEKWRLYVDGVRVMELANAGQAPLFALASGIAVTGEHVMYLEAVGTAFDATGQPAEVASGPSNVVRVNVVTGSLSAPKNVKVVGGGGL
jgi:hypothetical protein